MGTHVTSGGNFRRVVTCTLTVSLTKHTCGEMYTHGVNEMYTCGYMYAYGMTNHVRVHAWFHANTRRD